MSTIQMYIKEALLQSTETIIDDKKVKVGLSYDDCLKYVKEKVEKNPLLNGCKTSKNCITWYASHMRQENDKHYDKNILSIVRPKAQKATK